MLLHWGNVVTEMTTYFSTVETRCKGRPVASALGRRWQGWLTALAVVKHGVKEGHLLQHLGDGGRDGRLLQHWRNMVTRMAIGFSTGKTCWWRMPGGSALEKHGGREGHLIQQWENMVAGMGSYFSAGKYDVSDETVLPHW